jgi:serine protease Do
LPFSSQKLVEGGEVYAVGTPLSEKLQFSVTKGVVSGIRKIDDLEYIQSDVAVLPGSSGGPLLDSKGNAVEVTSRGLGVGVAVNFFIPLTDMDKYVPVDFE